MICAKIIEKVKKIVVYYNQVETDTDNITSMKLPKGGVCLK